MDAKELAIEIADVERRSLGLHMQRVAFDMRCVRLKHDLDEIRLGERNKVHATAMMIAPLLDNTMKKLIKHEKEEREQLRLEKEKEMEAIRLARKEQKEKELADKELHRREREEHRRKEEEAKELKRQQDLEKQRREKEQKAEQDRIEKEKQALLEAERQCEIKLKKAAEKQEKENLARKKEEEKAAKLLEQQIAVEAAKKKQDEKATKKVSSKTPKEKIQASLPTSLDQKDNASDSDDFEVPNVLAKKKSVKVAKTSKKKKATEVISEPAVEMNAQQDNADMMEDHGTEKISNTNKGKRKVNLDDTSIIAKKKQKSSARLMKQITEDEKLRKKNEKRKERERLREEKQNAKESTKKLTVDKKTELSIPADNLNDEEKVNEILPATKKKTKVKKAAKDIDAPKEAPPKPAKKQSKKTKSSPTEDDDRSKDMDIAEDKPIFIKAKKQIEAPRQLVANDSDDEDDEDEKGISLFDRLAQKMKQQFLAKSDEPKKAVPIAQKRPIPTPETQAAPQQKKTFLTSIFSVPQLKK